ncbi:hypothetical protein ACLM5J_04775 [Nocardioides sp. Bht2]|uniref:hypothetical protein n=1 Tax=Nocardioides sp. Bht2 TaxID=3392297 RepID=UPI0039B3D502
MQSSDPTAAGPNTDPATERTLVPAAPATPSTPPRSFLQQVIVGLLAVAWIVVAVSWLLSPQSADWRDLADAVERGEVSSIELDDHTAVPRDPEATFSNLVRITWKQGWRSFHTVVRESSSQSGPEIKHLDAVSRDLAPISWGAPTAEPSALMRDVTATLQQVAPDVSVRSGHPDPAGSVYDRPVPGWVLAMGAIGLIDVALHLYFGPEPAFATRWAWYWIIANPIPFLGLLAYLTMLFLRRPGPQAPARVTGGWTFLFCIAAIAVLGA